MQKLIQFAGISDSSKTNQHLLIIEEIIEQYISKSTKLGIWDDAIVSLVFTNNFEEDIKKKANLWHIDTEITKEKEYSVVSKILFNLNLESPQYIIFFNWNFLLSVIGNLEEILINRILSVKSRSIFPIEILKKQYIPQPLTLENKIESALFTWVEADYVYTKTRELVSQIKDPIDKNALLNSFKRKLKKDLYFYNSDKLKDEDKTELFFLEYLKNLNNFFLRISENQASDPKIKIKDNCGKVIYEILEIIKENTNRILHGKDLDIKILHNKINEFSNFFGICIENINNTSIKIGLTINPKSLFKDLVDTESRIVCFLDILGFSDYVAKYDQDITSTFLQEIQESFSLAMMLLRNEINLSQSDDIEYLEYKTFSDNICISIPYFDNEIDFLSNFNIIATYVRGFQSIMMSKGFYLRGGISIGSYYSDENIIFSKGLINAYTLESKVAIYPRVIIDELIINKILGYNPLQVSYFKIDKYIVIDSSKISFLNPFNLTKTTIVQIDSIFNNISDLLDEEYKNILTPFLSSISDFAHSGLKDLEKRETEELKNLKSDIIQKVFENNDRLKVQVKYIWLLEFLKWVETGKIEEISFYMFDQVDGLT